MQAEFAGQPCSSKNCAMMAQPLMAQPVANEANVSSQTFAEGRGANPYLMSDS